MVTKVEGYQCQYCGELYTNESDAEHCENMHVPAEELHILEGTHLKPEEAYYATACGYFPAEIIVEKVDFSGTAAMYKLMQAGSVEEIYAE